MATSENLMPCDSTKIPSYRYLNILKGLYICMHPAAMSTKESLTAINKIILSMQKFLSYLQQWLTPMPEHINVLDDKSSYLNGNGNVHFL